MDDEAVKILLAILTFGIFLWVVGLAKDSTTWKGFGYFFMCIGGGPFVAMGLTNG